MNDVLFGGYQRRIEALNGCMRVAQAAATAPAAATSHHSVGGRLSGWAAARAYFTSSNCSVENWQNCVSDDYTWNGLRLFQSMASCSNRERQRSSPRRVTSFLSQRRRLELVCTRSHTRGPCALRYTDVTVISPTTWQDKTTQCTCMRGFPRVTKSVIVVFDMRYCCMQSISTVL